MPNEISTTRIEPLGTSADKDAEYRAPRKREPTRVSEAKAVAPAADVAELAEGEREDQHQLDERA